MQEPEICFARRYVGIETVQRFPADTRLSSPATRRSSQSFNKFAAAGVFSIGIENVQRFQAATRRSPN